MESDNKKRPVSEEFNDITASLDYSRKRLYRLTGKVNEVMESITKLEKDLMIVHKNAERELEEQKNQLEKDQGKFNEIMTKIDETVLASSQYVTLNVGGDKFCIRPEVAAKYPLSYFGGLFSGRHELKKEADGSIFIDRSGTLFRRIADFLRSEKLMVELSEVERELLLDEARYYCLDALIAILDPEQNIPVIINVDDANNSIHTWARGPNIIVSNKGKTARSISGNVATSTCGIVKFLANTGIYTWSIKIDDIRDSTRLTIGITSGSGSNKYTISHTKRNDGVVFSQKLIFNANAVFTCHVDTNDRRFTIKLENSIFHFYMKPNEKGWHPYVELGNGTQVSFC